MIRFRDATLLAITKLRTRKIRTGVTVALASLLFGVLVAGSLVLNGTFDSIDNFSKDGLTNRYIVSVYKATQGNNLRLTLSDQDLVKQADIDYNDLTKRKKTEAEKLGIDYDEERDQKPFMTNLDGGKTLNIRDPNGITSRLLAQKYGDKPYMDDGKLRSVANSYGAIDFFTVDNLSVKRGSTFEVLPDGKEKFVDSSDLDQYYASQVDSAIDGMFGMAPPEITQPFMLDDNSGWKPDDGTLPIILPQDSVEQLLGLDSLPNNANSDQKLERIKQVRDQAASLAPQACYRDEASQSLIQQTITQQKEIKAHKNDKDYQQPDVIYQLPDTTKCAEPTIISDARSDEQKQLDQQQKLFDQKFGLYDEPQSYFVKFKIVGITPTQSDEPNDVRSAADIINNLLTTGGLSQLIPRDLYDQIADKSKYSDILAFEPLYLIGSEDNKSRYIEFASAKDAEKFIDEQGCTVQYDGICKPAGRDYTAALAFNNSVALNDVRDKAGQWVKVAILAAAVLAAIIMWITIGRTIADGRHETATFRAIGFKRIDIIFIYKLYTIILSILIALVALLVGFIGSYIVDKLYAPNLTAQAQYAFGGLDLSKEVSLIGINIEQLMIIMAVCVATGLLGMIVPLLRNVRRNPIRDMRDDG